MGHHTTWQPTFAIPLVPLLSSRPRSLPNPSNPGCYLPIVFSVCLSFSLPIQCPGRLSWQVPKLLWHAHTTSFCVFLQWTRVLRRVQWLSESLVMWSLYEMPRRRLKLLISTVCIFFSISAANVQVSQEYTNIDMTRERNSLIVELRSMILSSQMILSFAQSWSVFQAWILRQWLWLPNIWSFGLFPASRHWPWCYCWCHWCCWSSM